MATLWFALAAVMLAGYVVLDGFDFGAGVLHLFLAHNDAERRQVLGAIGPFWDGNEVWLLAGGGVLFLAFPKVLASGLSGFYLAIMMLLWTLILRGIAIEFRSHVADGMWRQFWDAAFALASALAPILLGAALGNVIRGVPLNGDGWFALPLFASFSPHGALGILDWYTVLAGVVALVAIAHHGALFLAWKTEGAVRDRAVMAAGQIFPVMVGVWALATTATWWVTPALFAMLPARPAAWLSALLALTGLTVSFVARRAGRDGQAFAGSAAFLLGLLAATAACAWPTMLRSSGDAARSLTALNAAAAPESLAAGLWWWPVGFALAVAYLVIVFRLHRGRVAAYTSGSN